MDNLLDGKVALVIGAGRGLGRVVATELARHGAAVAVAARSDHELAEKVADKLADASRAHPRLVLVEAGTGKITDLGDATKYSQEAVDAALGVDGVGRHEAKLGQEAIQISVAASAPDESPTRDRSAP